MNGLPPSHHFMPGVSTVGQLNGSGNQMPIRTPYNNSANSGLSLHNSVPNSAIGITMSGSPAHNPIHSMLAQINNGVGVQPMGNTMGVTPINNSLTGTSMNNGLGVAPMSNGVGVAHSPSSTSSMMSSPYGMPNLLQTQSSRPPSVPSNCDFNGNLQHSLQTNQSQHILQTSNHSGNGNNIAIAQSSGINQQQSKEINTASLCRIGQETVQDIVSRTQDVFQTLKVIQPPNGTAQSSGVSNDKKVKVQEQLRTIRVLFKRLRLIYEKCNENCQLPGMEYTHIESLIPFKDEMDPKHDEKKNTEVYRMACDESKEILEQVVMKNKQLKEAIDHLRRIIWEINTMLTMRKS